MSYKPPKLVVPHFPTFYKAFGSDIVSQTNEILVSNYILPGMMPTLISAMQKTQLNLHEIYFVCPQYINKITGELADCQLTITGTPFKDEPLEYAAFREIKEETGIAPTNIYKSVQRLEGHKRSVQNFWCEIDSQTPLSPQSDASAATTSLTQDDKTRKAQILVFGKLSELIKLLGGPLYPLPSDDTKPEKNTLYFLGGFLIISGTDVMEIAKILQQPHAHAHVMTSETSA
jgi:hypothetical protein